MSGPPKILAIGTATQDVFLVGGELFKPQNENGISYEHLPLGEKLELDDVVFSTGGNAMNAAITFARQGIGSSFMGLIGSDPAAEVILRVLDEEGIETKYVQQQPHYRTSYSSILLAPNGERTILRYHGEKLRAGGGDLDLNAINEADWLYVSSVGSFELLEKIVALAAHGNVKVAFNPGTLELEEPMKLKSLLEDITLLSANKEEIEKLFEGRSLEELVRHAASLVPVVLISDGPRGAIVADGKKIVRAGIYKDVPVVDRTGAGDAFSSGFVAKYAAGESLETAISFASANSTSVVGQIGATPGILHRHAHIEDMPLKTADF